MLNVDVELSTWFLFPSLVSFAMCGVQPAPVGPQCKLVSDYGKPSLLPLCFLTPISNSAHPEMSTNGAESAASAHMRQRDPYCSPHHTHTFWQSQSHWDHPARGSASLSLLDPLPLTSEGGGVNPTATLLLFMP